MKVPVEFEITLESPMIIGAERQARVPSSLRYIPGSTLRGALLAAHYRLHGEDELLTRLMSPGRSIFPFLYPGPMGTTPRALSTVLCKREGPNHPVEDVLAARYHALERGRPEDAIKLDTLLTCPTCGQPRRQGQGYWKGGEPVNALVVSQRMNVGIDRRTGTASQGVLFGTQSVEQMARTASGEFEPTIFGGRGAVDEEDLASLEEICREPLYFGKYRSRGFGKAKAAIRRTSVSKEKHKALKRGCYTYSKNLGEKEMTVFTLDVTSPLVAMDKYLRSTVKPKDWLPPELEAEELHTMLGQVVVSGWDQAANMPKEDSYAVAPGSVVLARSRLEPNALVEVLLALEHEGIGERREEGFGHVIANDRFRVDLLVGKKGK